MATPGQDPHPTSHQHDDLDFEKSWAAFLETRQWVREAVSDDELRAFGFNVAELDRKPEAGDFP